MKKRSDGYYQKKIVINGKTRFIYAKSVKELDQKIMKATQEPQKENSSSKRFGYWADAWWIMHRDTIKVNTQVCYTKPLADCKEYFKDYKIDEIKPVDVSKYIKEQIDKGYARQTVKVRHIVLSKIFDYAILNGIVTANPVSVVEIPKGLSHNDREGLTEKQIEKVNRSNNLFALFLLYTGMRRNEALAIRWEDIDFKTNVITVNKQVLWQTAAPPEIIDTTKSKSGNRAVPLLKPLAERLLKEKIHANQCSYIFSYNGGIMTKSGYKSLWREVKRDCEDDTITAHQFRHAYITMLWASGIDAKTAQSLAGHAKVEIMLDIYTHLNKTAALTAAEKLNNYIEGSSMEVKTTSL